MERAFHPGWTSEPPLRPPPPPPPPLCERLGRFPVACDAREAQSTNLITKLIHKYSMLIFRCRGAQSGGEQRATQFTGEKKQELPSKAASTSSVGSA